MVDKISGDEYYETLEKLDCPTLLEGRVTMEHYNAKKEPFIANDSTPVGMTSVYKAIESDKYMVAVDTHGKLRWPAPEIDGTPLICIVSEQVPQEYLEMLQKEKISYICVGHDAIDLHAAMEILRMEFGVERMVVLGGGHINGGFLAAGLIDEVSLLLAPGIDGRKGQTALFDGIPDMDRMPVRLSLESVEHVANGTLWIRYKTNY
jgi:riboflavin biosynthesis pyrimidine reductase